MSRTSQSRTNRLFLSMALLTAISVSAYLLRDRLAGWQGAGAQNESPPLARKTLASTGGDHDAHDHGSHAHDHPRHNEANSLELSAQARNSIGVRLMKVELGPFQKTVTIPGIITERPGRTRIEVSAPLTGVITRISTVQGEAVRPGTMLAELRLTHEELVQAQGALLQTSESLEVTRREIARVEALVREGSIPGKTLIDLRYELQKAEAVLHAQTQTLLLHGLSEEQVNEILRTRKLLPKLAVYAPAVPAPESAAVPEALQVQELRVSLGQHVTAGDVLFVLADQRELYIEGRAFEQDVPAISQALAEDRKVSALIDAKSPQVEDLIGDLAIAYLANQVDPDSRAFRFYVSLPNRVLRDRATSDGRHYVDWEFKPGQRVQIRIPVEEWQNRIVLPVGAIATDGSESFAFQANGDHFDRRPVHVEYRDQVWAVIANDGSLFPGDEVAASGAFQMQTALKNKAGGAPDPHAGHQH